MELTISNSKEEKVKKLVALAVLLLMMGGAKAAMLASGGGEGINAYYWWNDDRAIAWAGGSGWFAQPQKLPWMMSSWDGASVMVRYGAPGIGVTADQPALCTGFVRWIELAGQQTDNTNQYPYVGFICGQDDYTRTGIPLKFGAKVGGAELLNDFYFYFAEMEPVPTKIDINTNGWAAFNSHGAVWPEGKIPNAAEPNATIAAFWQNFQADENSYTPGAGDDTKRFNAAPFNSPAAVNAAVQTLPDSGVVFYALRVYQFGTAVNVPVFVIEWFNVKLATGDENERYTFQLQLINPTYGDPDWARYLGRRGKPGRDATEMTNYASLRGQALIPEFIVALFNCKQYNGFVSDNWWNYERNDIELMGVEDGNGLRGLSTEAQTTVRPYDNNLHSWSDTDYGIKYDYWKRCREDLGVYITNPPFNIVLRWTNIQPRVWVTNYGRNATPPDGAPISLDISKGSDVIHTDRVDVYLPGLGTDRNKEPNFANGTIKEVTYPKKWKPGEIGENYHIKLAVTWDLDTCVTGNNIQEKDVKVHCDDTLAYHDGSVAGYAHIFSFAGYWTNADPFPEHYSTYYPNAGAPIHEGSIYPTYGHAWIKALRTNIGDYGWGYSSPNVFNLTAVYDKGGATPAPAIGTGFEAGQTNWDPLQALGSYNHDGWWAGFCDNIDGTPAAYGWNESNRWLGTTWYTDRFYLGLGIAENWWLNTYSASCMTSVRPSVGMGVSFGGAVTPVEWQVVAPEQSTWINPYACATQCGAAWPQFTTCCIWGDMNWYPPIAYIMAAYPGQDPVNWAQDAAIHTGIHDIAAYLIKKPLPAADGNYYFEDNKELSSEIMIANIGEGNETNTNAHPMEAIARVDNANDSTVWMDYVGITSLNVGDSFDAVLPKWPSTGDAGCCIYQDPNYPCDKDYTLYLIASLRYPGMHEADHCPYNDTLQIPFKVLWTYDIAVTGYTIDPEQQDYNPGDVVSLKAKFRNLGINDTVNIPVRCEIADFNTGNEIYFVSRNIVDLNWRGSPAGPPNEVEVDFGTWTVPDGFTSNVSITFRIAEGFVDECDENDFVTWSQVGVAETPTLPKSFELSAIRPNPFVSTTEISYALPVTSPISLKVYDITGKLVKTLVNGSQVPNFYRVSWNGIDDRGQKVGQGIYILRMETPSYQATKKFILLAH